MQCNAEACCNASPIPGNAHRIPPRRVRQTLALKLGGASAPKDDNSIDLEHLQRTYETFNILACDKVALLLLAERPTERLPQTPFIHLPPRPPRRWRNWVTAALGS